MSEPAKNLAEKIAKLKIEKNAVILVHNYQMLEVQDVADFVGDSLGLSESAAATDAKMIVFCGVRFMAETAKILSPNKRVVVPRLEAGCPMADMITADDVKELRKKHPDASIVAYVNTNADVKAEVDVCCTSANAVKVIQKLDAKRIVFVPDENLAAYCQRFTDKEIIAWDGFCYVHNRIRKEDILKAKAAIPDAVVVVHPECRPEVIDISDEVRSTSGMVKFVKESGAQRFIIGTEEGLIRRLKRDHPEKEFYSAGAPKVCRNMKLTTLEDVYLALLNERHEMTLPTQIIERARKLLERMLEHI